MGRRRGRPDWTVATGRRTMFADLGKLVVGKGSLATALRTITEPWATVAFASRGTPIHDQELDSIATRESVRSLVALGIGFWEAEGLARNGVRGAGDGAEMRDRQHAKLAKALVHWAPM